MLAASAGIALAARDTLSLRIVRRRLVIERMPAELDGLRVLHVSDVHAGFGPGLSLLGRVIALAAREHPDLIVVTGDLVTRHRASRRATGLLDRLADEASCGAFAVLGNHDVGHANDPFAQGWDPVLERLVLLDGGSTAVVIRGVRVAVAGVSAKAYLAGVPAAQLVPAPPAPPVDLSLLLCHFPAVAGRLPANAADVVFCGHLHGGQICLPWPGGRVSLAHPRQGNRPAVSVRDGIVTHISGGIGTTFVPMRFLARAEVSLLTLASQRNPPSGASETTDLGSRDLAGALPTRSNDLSSLDARAASDGGD